MSALAAAALHLARPSMTEWADDASAQLHTAPQPTDTAVAVAEGPDPHRVLLIGSGPAAGRGTTSHDFALTGALARALRSATARGTVVEAAVDSSMTVACVAPVLARHDLALYDAVVVCIGDVDALRGLGVENWRERWSAALALWQRRMPHPRPLLIVGVGGMADESGVGSVHGWLAEHLAVRYNDATEQLVRGVPGAQTTLLPRTDRVGGRPTAEAYALWGAQLAAELSTALIRGHASEPATLKLRRGVEQLGSSLGS